MLKVIPYNKGDEILTNFFNDFKALKAGKIIFYEKITTNYININREYCKNFLISNKYIKLTHQHGIS